MKNDPYIENNIGVALPSQIDDDIFQLTHQLSSNGKPADTLDIVRHIVSDMVTHANIILLNNDTDPLATMPESGLEVEQTPVVANATAVLNYGKEMLDALKTGKHLDAILIMYKLASSAVRAELLQKTFEGVDQMVAREKGSKASTKLKSVLPLLEQAIASGSKPNAKALWSYIEKHHPSATPFTYEVRKEIEPPPSEEHVNKFKRKDPSASTEIVDTIELYFDLVKQSETDEGVETIFEYNSKGEEKTLNFSSFKRYVTEVKTALKKINRSN